MGMQANAASPCAARRVLVVEDDPDIGRLVMLQLAELRRVPNWQDLDTVLEPDGEEAA